MPRSAIKQRLGVTKTDDLLEAEQAGRVMLNTYTRAKQGNQAALARKTDLLAGTICKMCNGGTQISMEAAILIEVATEGVLRADKLCPSRAELLDQLLKLRAGAIDQAE